MAVNTVGISPAANFIPTIFETEAGDAVQANIVLAELVDTSFEQKMRVGRVIAIVDKSNPAVRVKSEDVSATWSNRTETQQTITISRQAYVAFLVEDIAEIQSQADLRNDYTEKSGYSLAAFMEGDVTSGLASLPSSFSNLVGVLGSDPTDDDWLRAVQFLDDYDVPRGSRFIYASPSAHLSLQKLNKFTNAQSVGQANAERAVLEARVGQAYGCQVYVSSLANNNPSTANQSYSWLCHPRGVALIRQRKPTVHTQYVILETGWGVLVDLIYNFAERLIAPLTLGGGTSTDQFNSAVRGG